MAMMIWGAVWWTAHYSKRIAHLEWQSGILFTFCVIAILLVMGQIIAFHERLALFLLISAVQLFHIAVTLWVSSMALYNDWV